jgi:hypothetical protein
MHHPKEGTMQRTAALPALFSLLLLLVGCIGVTPLPKKTKTPAGPELKAIDVNFIKPGATSRDEVKKQLAPVDTGYECDRFFVGRWSYSNSGGWIVLASYYSTYGNATRFWSPRDLIVEFDQRGVVQGYTIFPDSHLSHELPHVAAACPSMVGRELHVSYWKGAEASPAMIVLENGQFRFAEVGTAKKAVKFTVPAQDLLGIRAWRLETASADHTTQILHFRNDLRHAGGPRGKTIKLDLTLPQVLMLMKGTFLAAPTAVVTSAESTGNNRPE